MRSPHPTPCPGLTLQRLYFYGKLQTSPLPRGPPTLSTITPPILPSSSLALLSPCPGPSSRPSSRISRPREPIGCALGGGVCPAGRVSLSGISRVTSALQPAPRAGPAHWSCCPSRKSTLFPPPPGPPPLRSPLSPPDYKNPRNPERCGCLLQTEPTPASAARFPAASTTNRIHSKCLRPSTTQAYIPRTDFPNSART